MFTEYVCLREGTRLESCWERFSARGEFGRESRVAASVLLGYSGQNFVGIAALRRVHGNGCDDVIVDLTGRNPGVVVRVSRHDFGNPRIRSTCVNSPIHVIAPDDRRTRIPCEQDFVLGSIFA